MSQRTTRPTGGSIHDDREPTIGLERGGIDWLASPSRASSTPRHQALGQVAARRRQPDRLTSSTTSSTTIYRGDTGATSRGGSLTGLPPSGDCSELGADVAARNRRKAQSAALRGRRRAPAIGVVRARESQEATVRRLLDAGREIPTPSTATAPRRCIGQIRNRSSGTVRGPAGSAAPIATLPNGKAVDRPLRARSTWTTGKSGSRLDPRRRSLSSRRSSTMLLDVQSVDELQRRN